MLPYRKTLIAYYFTMGLNYSEILALLSVRHNITISMRTLKRDLQKMKCYRKKKFSDIGIVSRFIEEQLEESGQMHGYRWMHLKCIQHGFVVTRSTVRLLLQILDPEGVRIRKRRRLRRRKYFNKGPNFVWHIDSYDKLKPYGIAINGAIDGFSRYIIWMQATKNASDPKVIGGFFTQAVRKHRGCPRRMRSDLGTENRYVEQFQIFFRRFPMDDNDLHYGSSAHLYGTSTSNQRIESWWAQLRKQCSQFWMNLFQTLKEDGLFTGTYLDKSLIQFCFLKTVQDDLNKMVDQWNSHIIRSTRNSISPSGRPVIMYTLPEAYSTNDYLCPTSQEDVELCEEESTFFNTSCDEDVHELCTILMNENNLSIPDDPYNCTEIYTTLKNIIKMELESL